MCNWWYKNGNVTRYIAKNYDKLKLKYNICDSIECNADSDCLSIICTNKHCTYNDDESIIHCDDTYVPGFLFIKESSFLCIAVRQGGYHCKSYDECYSNICNKICTQQSKRYEEWICFYNICKIESEKMFIEWIIKVCSTSL